MDRGLVCRVCLSKDNVEKIVQEENKDLLAKLRLVGRVSILEDEHLQQCICRACSSELQFAYDLISQYEATYNKLRNVSLHPKNVKAKPSTVSFCEMKPKTKVEQIEEEMQAARADNILVAEIVVKEEIYADDEGKIECLESKITPDCIRDNYKYKIERADIDGKYEEKLSGLDSEDSNFNGNCPERLNKHKTDQEDCKVRNLNEENAIEPSDAELSMHESRTINIVVKQEKKLADEVIDEVKPNCKEETSVAATLENSKRDSNENAANECGVSNKRFHGNVQAHKMLLCKHRRGLNSRECSKCEKYIQLSTHEATTKEHQSKAAILSRSKLKECPESFVHLKSLNMKMNRQENNPQTNAFESHKSTIPFKYGKSDLNLLHQYLLKQQNAFKSNPELQACDKWSKVLANGRLLEKRSRTDVYKCESCDEWFSCKKYLRQHEIKHSNPELLSCEHCGNLFVTEHLMNEHRMLHMNPDAFKCKQCGKSFSSTSSLEKHTVVHANPELLPCEQCGKTFTNVYRLREHQKWHSNPDAFKCEQCDKRCSSKGALRLHRITHSNSKLLPCDKCEKIFSCVSMLDDHQKWHLNPDAFKCQQCDKQFSSKSNLRRHSMIHSSPGLHTCEKCGKSFLCVYRLREHQMWHLYPDSFKCEQCGKRCPSKGALRLHKTTHSNTKLLTSEQC